MFGPSVTYQVKLMQSTAMEQKRLDLRLLLPALLVLVYWLTVHLIFFAKVLLVMKMMMKKMVMK